MERYEEIEKSLKKKYRSSIWCRFTSGINEYQLVKEGDKIAVSISGGKDSMLMAKLMQELQRHITAERYESRIGNVAAALVIEAAGPHGIAIARLKRPHHRMFGQVALQ